MDYYRLLHLVREPFSNSPDPVFFYRARSHAECLQRLEIALRLKRGLNLVVGEVGAGKTTICRQLLRSLSGEAATDVCLLLDPAAESRGEFLAKLLDVLGDGADLPATAEERKERVKKLLLRRVAEEGRLAVLLVDEGQKIHPGDLETLREILNFETNEHKLLQVVIFAQLEFLELLRDLPNVADRVNDLIRLEPFSFAETRRMIRYRLEMSAEGQGGGVGRGVFTLPALWAVHRATGGYPRKIVHLCHHLVLAMIVQNRARIGWRLVRATLARGAASLGGRRSWTRPVAAGLALAGLAVASAFALAPQMADRPDLSVWRAALAASFFAKVSESASSAGQMFGQASGQASGQTSGQASGRTLGQEAGRTVAPTSADSSDQTSGQALDKVSGQASSQAPGQTPGHAFERTPEGSAGPASAQSSSQTGGQTPGHPTAAMEPAPSRTKGGFDGQAAMARYPAERETVAAPDSLGEVTVMAGENLSQLLRMIYGQKTPKVMSAVAERNPAVGNPSLIKAGATLVMPAVPAEPAPQARAGQDDRGRFIAQLDLKDRLEDAVQAVRALRGRYEGLAVLPYWSPSRGMRFAVCLSGWRRSEAEAQADILRLDPVLRQGAKPVGRWESGTMFYSALGAPPEPRQAALSERKADGGSVGASTRRSRTPLAESSIGP